MTSARRKFSFTRGFHRDITERRRAEEQLRERDAQYRGIFEATSDAMAIITMDGIVVEVNPAHYTIFGYTRDEMVGKRFTSLIHPDYYQYAAETFAQVRSGGATEGQVLCIRKDGSPVHIEGRASVFTYMGSPHVLSVLRDVTDRVVAEEQRREREAQYRGIFEATTDGIAITSLEGIIIEANPALCQMLGYSYDEIIGRHIGTIVYPEDQGLHEEGVEAAQAGRSNAGQARLFRKDGTSFIGGGTSHPVVYMGKPHLLSVMRDVTAEAQAYELLEKHVEERTRELSAVLEVAHNVASTLELEPLLGLVLDQLQTIVTYTGAAIFIVEEDQVRVLDYRGPIPPEKLRNFRLPLQDALGYQAVRRLQAPIIVDETWPSSSGIAEHGDLFGYFSGMVPYARSWLVVPLLVKERVIGVVRIDHEGDRAYTQHHARLAMALATQAAVAIENARLYGRVQQAAALEERQRLARELHDSVTQALYGVTMYAEAAASVLHAGDVETASTYLQEVRSTGLAALQEMRLLIFELRPPVLEQEGLEAALRARLAAVEGRIANLSTSVEVESDLKLPTAVEQAVYGVAQETLNNVIKHAGATALRLSLRREAGIVTLEIADNGRGFDMATARGGGGLGIRGMGERVEQIGGRLTVQSAPGQGTVVRVEVTV